MVKNARTTADPLSVVIQKLTDGEYVIPDFQRGFVWEADDITQLVRSVFHEYYIGSLLLWEGSDAAVEEINCLPIPYSGSDASTGRRTIILDGQQRLSAMYYAFFAPSEPLPGRSRSDLFFVRVNQLMGTGADSVTPDSVVFRRDVRTASPHDSIVEFESHEFPVRLLSSPEQLRRWIIGYKDYWTDKAREFEQDYLRLDQTARQYADMGDSKRWEVSEEAAAVAAERANLARQHEESAVRFGNLVDALRTQYQISYIELDEDLGRESVIDIFTQINRQGRQLTPFDMINAQLSLKGIHLKDLAAQAHKALDADGFRLERNDADLIRIMLIRSHPDHRYDSPTWQTILPFTKPREQGNSSALFGTNAEFHREWNAAVASLRDGLAALKTECHYGSAATARVSDFVPFVGMIPAYCALRSLAGESRRKRSQVRQWYWASVLTERYYRADSEALGSKDYRETVDWFEAVEQAPSAVSEFKQQFGPGKIGEAGVAGQQVPLYRSVMSLMFAMEPRDFQSGEQADAEEVVEVPVVPTEWCKENGVARDAYDSVFNLMLVPKKAQAVMGKRMPSAYFPELLSRHGEDRAEMILRSHFISRDAYNILRRQDFEPSDFSRFLHERERLFLDSIGEEIFDGARLGIPVRPRDLLNRREAIEKNLRELIGDVLLHAERRIPDNIRPKLKGRSQAEHQRHPGTESPANLEQKTLLEFADLTDLQAIITNKLLWELFEPTFKNKEHLTHRFDGLVGVRISDAHVRSATASATLDGEAAVEWFERALG